MGIAIRGQVVRGLAITGQNVNGVAYGGIKIWEKPPPAPMPLSDKNIGDIVRITVGGAARNYIIVHKGNPSSDYVGFVNTVTLMQQDVEPNRVWHSPTTTDYQNSDINAYLNSTFFNSIALNIRNRIPQIRIPFRVGNSGTTINSGANGLLCRIFLPSRLEVGFPIADNQSNEGAKFDYFLLGSSATGEGFLARQRRIALREGIAVSWWSRSVQVTVAAIVNTITNVGASQTVGSGATTIGVRPVFVLPGNLIVNTDGTVLA
jgi:hypothetical protein